MLIRLSKIMLVLCVASFALLVGYNNLVDYQSNFQFVQHVLTMDTTFPGNTLKSRAIADPAWHHAAYALIIATEFLTGILCLIGACKLGLNLRSNPASFNRAKGYAILGLTLGFMLWFAGFMTIGAEWFLMWQSEIWNGQESAFRFVVCLGVVLLFVAQEDKPH